jgi:hypothetical protein
MTCQECELALAEDVSAPGVEAHLRDCPDCRALAADLRQNAEALQSMRFDPVPAQLRLRRGQGWIWAAAAAVVLAAGLAALRLHPVPQEAAKVELPAPNPRVSGQVHAPVPAPVLPVARARKPPRRVSPAQIKAREEPLLVQFLTPDPDIVIYWLVEPKEEGVL